MHRLKNGTEMCNIIHKRLTGGLGRASKFRGFATYQPEIARYAYSNIGASLFLSLHCLWPPEISIEKGDVRKGFRRRLLLMLRCL